MFDRPGTPSGILAAMLAGAALFVSASAAAQDAHGVIAVGKARQGDGVAYGFAWNYPAKAAARAEAMNACASSGGTDCVEAAWFRNGCGALAIDQHGIAAGKPGMTREQAETRALQTCRAAGGAGCAVAGSLCAAPDGEPGIYSGSEQINPAQGAQTTAGRPADRPLARGERVLLQQALNALGFDAGPADGVSGRRTRSAVREWQKAGGHEATGRVTREQFAALTAAAAAGPGEEPRQETADNPSNRVLSFGREPGLAQRLTGDWKLARFAGCTVDIDRADVKKGLMKRYIADLKRDLGRELTSEQLKELNQRVDKSVLPGVYFDLSTKASQNLNTSYKRVIRDFLNNPAHLTLSFSQEGNFQEKMIILPNSQLGRSLKLTEACHATSKGTHSTSTMDYRNYQQTPPACGKHSFILHSAGSISRISLPAEGKMILNTTRAISAKIRNHSFSFAQKCQTEWKKVQNQGK